MKLITYLESVISRNEGIVQTQLAREDLARVEKLRELAKTHDTYAALEKDGLYIGWTKGDFRTHELSDPIKALMRAVYNLEKTGDVAKYNDRIMDIWAAFHTLRLKTLVHCL
ncbi:MAG: hypothetical protein L3J65_07160 [Robiginitomaculum sp.]|nr:hypothetical protein [Robiginitomaculum sp.]